MAMDQAGSDDHLHGQEKRVKSTAIDLPPGIPPPGLAAQPAATDESDAKPAAEEAKPTLQPVVVPAISYGGAQAAGMGYAGAAYAGAKGLGRSHAKVPRRVDLAKEFTSQKDDSSSQITTVMIRNVPNQYHRGHLMQELDKLEFSGKYDFVHLPIDQQTKWNVGYAFVNFDSSDQCTRCMEVMVGHKFTKLHPGQQTRQALVSVAHLQGLDKNLAHFRDKVVFSSGSGLLQPWVRPSSMPAQNTEYHQEWDSCGDDYWDANPAFMWHYMMAYDQEYQQHLQLMSSVMPPMPLDQSMLHGREEALEKLDFLCPDTDGLPDASLQAAMETQAEQNVKWITEDSRFGLEAAMETQEAQNVNWITEEVDLWLKDSHESQNTDGRQPSAGTSPSKQQDLCHTEETLASAFAKAPEETSAPDSAPAQPEPAQGEQTSLGMSDWPELSVAKTSPGGSRRRRGGR